VLGFATVNVGTGDGALTIWLRSQLGRTPAGHTNAVAFPSGDAAAARAEAMWERGEGSHPSGCAETVPHTCRDAYRGRVGNRPNGKKRGGA
jgi:hypothetical protein